MGFGAAGLLPADADDEARRNQPAHGGSYNARVGAGWDSDGGAQGVAGRRPVLEQMEEETSLQPADKRGACSGQEGVGVVAPALAFGESAGGAVDLW